MSISDGFPTDWQSSSARSTPARGWALSGLPGRGELVTERGTTTGFRAQGYWSNTTTRSVGRTTCTASGATLRVTLAMTSSAVTTRATTDAQPLSPSEGDP